MFADELEKLACQLSLGSVLAAYPDEEFESTCRWVLLEAGGYPDAGPLLKRGAQSENLDDLRGNYIELFDRGKERVSLYETEYGRMRGMSKGNNLADLSGFYSAFGLKLDDEETHEMLDHIAVELEFYALLVAKQAYLERAEDALGAEIVLDARRKFLGVHLGAFLSGLAGQTRVQDDADYGPLFAHLAELVAGECARLEVAVAPLDFFPDAELDKGPRCATSESLPVLP